MRRLTPVKWLACTIVVASIAYVTSHKLLSQTVSRAARKPFVAYQMERSFSDGDKARAHPDLTPSMVARRSDGSEAFYFTTAAPDGTQVESREVTDVRMGIYMIVDVVPKTVITFHHSPDKLYMDLQSRQSCPPEASGPTAQTGSTVLGHPVVAFTRVIADVTENIQAALDQDCYPLHLIQTFDAGSLNETEVTSMTAGEPSDSIFAVPAGYKEVSPSQANAEYAQRYPGRSLWDPKFLQTLDMRYYAHQ